jgi:hypothetical protein
MSVTVTDKRESVCMAMVDIWIMRMIVDQCFVLMGVGMRPMPLS